MPKIQAGEYRGRCTGPRDVKFGESQEGNLQIGLLLEVTAGECKGQRAVWYGGLGSEEAKAFTRKALLACGWDGKSWTELRGISDNCVRLVFAEEGDYIRLRYINPDTSVKFKHELPRDEVVRRLEAAGLAGPPAQTDDEGPPPFDDAEAPL